MPLVVIAGGGTGGHLYPGLALADTLVGRGLSVTFVGTAEGIEARVVPAAGYPFRVLPARQLRGGGLGRALAAVVATLRGALGALGLLRELKPRLVVGVGGYASVAVVMAAWLRRVPTLLLEQNVVPGAANRLLGRIARCICVGFDDSAAFFPEGRVVHTGNPVRAGVLSPTGTRSDGQLGLLIFGGSAGARRINQATLEALRLLGASARRLAITHQTGVADVDETRAGYAAMGLAGRVEPFIADMGGAYAAADVVVARAGAMTCAELTALGLPAVLVPYPYAADDHQRRNAEVLVRAGAAEMMKPRTGTKSQIPARTARSSAAGTFRMLSATSTNTVAKTDVAMFPAT